jgi:hypothetical protein
MSARDDAGAIALRHYCSQLVVDAEGLADLDALDYFNDRALSMNGEPHGTLHTFVVHEALRLRMARRLVHAEA